MKNAKYSPLKGKNYKEFKAKGQKKQKNSPPNNEKCIEFTLKG